MQPRRLSVAALILSLLLVPALARAAQTVDSGKHPTFSFRKSFDAPPDRIDVAPDRSAVPVDDEVLRHPVTHDVADDAERLLGDPDLLDADTPRGPPSRLLS